MKTSLAWVGARGVDSLPFSSGGTAKQAKKLFDNGIDFFVGYLGVMNPARLGYILDAGLAFMPVTMASNTNGPYAVDCLKKLGLPNGTTVWYDLEGSALMHEPVLNVINRIDDWAHAVKDAGFEPGLYIGSPQPMNDIELYGLAVVRYWKSPSRIVDRTGKVFDGPKCGFCMHQCYPSIKWPNTDLLVDVNFVQKDNQDRLPTWVKA